MAIIENSAIQPGMVTPSRTLSCAKTPMIIRSIMIATTSIDTEGKTSFMRLTGSNVLEKYFPVWAKMTESESTRAITTFRFFLPSPMIFVFSSTAKTMVKTSRKGRANSRSPTSSNAFNTVSIWNPLAILTPHFNAHDDSLILQAHSRLGS